MAQPTTSSMQVKIRSPFKTYFNGPALNLSAVNATGPFDILPRHKNFITLLKPRTPLVVRQAGRSDFKMVVARGVMHVKADQVAVFLDV